MRWSVNGLDLLGWRIREGEVRIWPSFDEVGRLDSWETFRDCSDGVWAATRQMWPYMVGLAGPQGTQTNSLFSLSVRCQNPI